MPKSPPVTPQETVWPVRQKVRGLSETGANGFTLTPPAEVRHALAAELGLLELRKLRFVGEIRATGKSGWQLQAELGATAVQSCVITAEPVTCRIDVPVKRLFQKPGKAETAEPEVEFDGNDSLEPLGTEINLSFVLMEALALALPDYPRAPEAKLKDNVYTAPGVPPLSDADTKPFASLAKLKDKLKE
jgi:uncharacterized metal-binding protein YceD (DUF177 family)